MLVSVVVLFILIELSGGGVADWNRILTACSCLQLLGPQFTAGSGLAGVFSIFKKSTNRAMCQTI